MNTGGTYNTNVGVYIGGASTAANAQVNVNLSGANNAVDATALGLSTTSVAGGGTSLTGNSVNLNNTASPFLVGSGTQAFTFNIAGPSGAAITVGATVSGGSGGLSGAQVISSLNSQLQSSGITAAIGANGSLEFSGSVAFSLSAVGAASAGNAVATSSSTIATNTANYNVDGGTPAVLTGTEALTFQNAGGSYNVTLSNVTGASSASAIQQINTQLQGSGITAVLGSSGEVNIQSANAFSVDQTTAATTGVGLFSGTGSQAVAAPTAGSSSIGNALAALASLQTAVKNLGLVQGTVGSGENVLADAIGLANSQITNESAAESQIRDADIATQAANLTKTQTLEQSSVAALAQANAAPQALLKLLQ